MGLVSKTIKVSLTKKQLKHAERLGYRIHDGYIDITQEDYLKYFNMNINIDFICDCCGRAFSYTTPLMKRKLKDKLFLCKKCLREQHTLQATNGQYRHTSQMPLVKSRYKSTVQERYGEEYTTPSQVPTIKTHQKNMTRQKCQEKYGKEYDNYMQVPAILAKRIQTVRERYGYDSIMQCPFIKQQIRNTTQQRYGYSWPSQVPAIKQQQLETTKQRFNYDEDITSVWAIPAVKEKIRTTVKLRYGVECVLQDMSIIAKIVATKKERGQIKTSKQQEHLCKLFKGELNHIVNKYLVDIALIIDKIAIEYDGGGHDLNVRLGLKTLERFKNDERRRTHVILQAGWKMIRFVAPQDKLLSDDEMLAILTWCKSWLVTHSTHIIYVYLEEDRIVSSTFSYTLTSILK